MQTFMQVTVSGGLWLVQPGPCFEGQPIWSRNTGWNIDLALELAFQCVKYSNACASVCLFSGH